MVLCFFFSFATKKIQVPFEVETLYDIIEKLYSLLNVENGDINLSKNTHKQKENIDCK